MRTIAALSCVMLCICSQTVFILCFNVIPHPTERLAPVDFPSLCNSGSEVKSGMCQHLSVLGVVNPAAEPEVPKYTGCLGNLGYQADFYSVNMLCGLVSLLFARFFFVYSFLGRSVFQSDFCLLFCHLDSFQQSAAVSFKTKNKQHYQIAMCLRTDKHVFYWCRGPALHQFSI